MWGATIVHEKKIPLWGRTLIVPQFSNGIAKMSFSELCGAPHSAADFLALSSAAHTLILTDIPRMSLEHRNEARRFITLIDTLYENKIKLFCSAEVGIYELFSSNGGGDVGRKNVSRLEASERLLMDDLKLSSEQVQFW